MNKLDWSKLTSRNFIRRVLSALVLIPVVMAIVIIGGSLYTAAIMAVAALGLHEWLCIVGRGRVTRSVRGWLGGLAYMGAFAAAMIYLLQPWDDAESPYTVIYLLLVVWATDIGGYVAGRLIGGPKLAPKISPNKTWAGLVGGVTLAVLVGYLFALFNQASDPWASWLMSAILAVVEQAGDLFESAIKRRYGVKDSGTLIPGHGGVLDRIDGLIFAAIFLAILTRFAVQY